MGRPIILVVDDSATTRETVRIVLGDGFDVTAIAWSETRRSVDKSTAQPDLLILGVTSPDAVLRVASGYRPAVPVLCLMDGAVPSEHASGRWRALPRTFSPHQLRECTAALLRNPKAPTTFLGNARLGPPFVPVQATRVLEQAVVSPLPLFLCGEPGTGKRTLAGAVHAAGDLGPLLVITGRSFASHPLQLDGALPVGTLFIDGVDQLNESGQEKLSGLLRADGLLAAPGGAVLRLITAAPHDLAVLLEAGRFPRDLYYRITILPVTLPPLRERAGDVPALAVAITATLCTSLGRPDASLTPGALEKLSNYAWFGNITELESVLARSLSVHRIPTLDAGHLLFEKSHFPEPLPAQPGALPENGRVASALELIAHELAHELRNPMVTIKTFAQHLQRALHNDEDREELARLTGEAVEHMDRVVENLLEFARLGAPAKRGVPLGQLLAEPVAFLEQEIQALGGKLECQAAPEVVVETDPVQTSYALKNLFHAIARHAGQGARVALSFSPSHAVRVEISNGRPGPGAQLASFVDADADSEPAMPLGVAIAQALFERNGGRLVVSPGAQPLLVTATFTATDH